MSRTVVVKCLQKEVAILSKLVTCPMLKFIGWLGRMRDFFPDILAMNLSRRRASSAPSQSAEKATD